VATVITQECINCGACEPECPNTAIYAGGVAYQLAGATLAALSNDFFYIVAEKCSECVGFLDHEACAAACPVDCCIPDPKRPESEEILMARARTLHPEKSFAVPPPSRFRKARPTSAAVVTASLAPKPPPLPEPAPAFQPKPPIPELSAAAKVASTAAAAEVVAAVKSAPPEKKAEVIVPATAVPPMAEAVAPVRAADPLADFLVPITCRNCQVDYSVPFRSLCPGANLRCPHCRASHSPTQEHFLLVSDRLRRYRVATAAASKTSGRGGAHAEKAVAPLRQSLEQDLRAISARLLSRPKRSRLGLS